VEDDSRVDVHDRFRESLSNIDASDDAAVSDALTSLAQRYSYVFPDDGSLTALSDIGPLVEVGAGTGYWAYRLRAIAVDIVAFDSAPPDSDRPNRYHEKTSTWTEVIAADHTILTQYPDRALLLCWPPLFSSLGECLTYYGGNTVAVIGDGGHRTARIQGLNDMFATVSVSPVHALEPDPQRTPTLSIWRRVVSRDPALASRACELAR
jgi:hypothetical protein